MWDCKSTTWGNVWSMPSFKKESSALFNGPVACPPQVSQDQLSCWYIVTFWPALLGQQFWLLRNCGHFVCTECLQYTAFLAEVASIFGHRHCPLCTLLPSYMLNGHLWYWLYRQGLMSGLYQWIVFPWERGSFFCKTWCLHLCCAQCNATIIEHSFYYKWTQVFGISVGS